MSITFYLAPMSSATPVAWAFSELDVPHERVVYDLPSGEHRNDAFLALNPNGMVPTIVVDGTPMFEALAIVMWLGERYGVERGLWPAEDAPARLEAMAWSTWAYVTYGPTFRRLTLAESPRVSPDLHNAGQARTAREELTHLLDILDARLAKAPYIVGADFSLADLIVSSAVGYGAICGVTVEDHPHVKDWLERCLARPACRAEWS
jgi:GST-like protein